MIPDIGLNMSIQRHFCGTEEDGRMTDDTNSHNCMTNGRAKRTSRYFTFKAAIHVPTPSPNNAVSKIKTGRNRTCAVKETGSTASSRTAIRTQAQNRPDLPALLPPVQSNVGSKLL